MKSRRVLITFAVVYLSAMDILANESLLGSIKNELAYQKLTIKNRDKIATLEYDIYTLRERVDGLTTVIEGLSAMINELQKRQLTPTVDNLSILETKIEKVSRECVRQEELNAFKQASQDGQVKRTNSVAPSEERSNKDDVLVDKSNAVIYSEGVRLFQKNKYRVANERFSLTLSKGYKPAASSYYLGEIGYYSKKYSDAIFYFKKSAELNDQASYIDTLLLHTAVSLDKTGDHSQAKVFYQTIINDYPEKKSAKIARKKMNNL